MKTITIRFGLGKAPVIEAHGFAGVGCQDATKAFENALGGRVRSVEPKVEFYSQSLDGSIQQDLGAGGAS